MPETGQDALEPQGLQSGGGGVRSPPLGLTPPEKPYGEQGRKEDLLRSWVCSDVPLPTGCPEAQEVRALQEDAASVGLTGQMP